MQMPCAPGTRPADPCCKSSSSMPQKTSVIADIKPAVSNLSVCVVAPQVWSISLRGARVELDDAHARQLKLVTGSGGIREQLISPPTYLCLFVQSIFHVAAAWEDGTTVHQSYPHSRVSPKHCRDPALGSPQKCLIHAETLSTVAQLTVHYLFALSFTLGYCLSLR